MSAPATLFWHDYETTGADPRRDRPLQFAGLRTDLDLQPIEDPCVFHCRPPVDTLPAPMACAVTGLGPRRAQALGMGEAEFAAGVLEELSRPGTCAIGYNSLRFDDEVTRHLLWRNLYEPYGREWRNGCSRWDLIDTLRLARALRPEGIIWPERDDGHPSFRLEDLAAANGIEHAAHDALADVHATIAMARLLRAAQPRLYEFAFGHRDRVSAGDLLRLDASDPVLHVSNKYSAARGCIAPVAALAAHPVNRNGVIVADLTADPAPWLEYDPQELAAALFTPAAERDPAAPRAPLKVVRLNVAPVLAPMSTLTPEAASRLAIDPDTARASLTRLRAVPGLADRLQQVFAPAPPPVEADVDVALYDGFVPDADRARMDAVHRCAPDDLAGFDPGFADARLTELYFRYRARNWPGTLDADERARWDELRRRRLIEGAGGSPRSLAEFRQALAEAVASGDVNADLAAELEGWAEELTVDLPAASEPVHA
ncbi:MAG: exodeoxyribonuclease I [Halofilum sp. (in: g-proteobacteria)]